MKAGILSLSICSRHKMFAYRRVEDKDDQQPKVGKHGEDSGHAEHAKVLDPEKRGLIVKMCHEAPKKMLQG